MYVIVRARPYVRLSYNNTTENTTNFSILFGMHIEYERDGRRIFLVENKWGIFGDLTYKALIKYHHQDITIISNKKWHTSGICCNHCWYVPYCRFCSIPIAYHIDAHGEFFGLCRLCKTVYLKPSQCEQCWYDDISNTGIWIQQIQQRITYQWRASTIVQSDNTNSLAKLKKLYPLKTTILLNTYTHKPLWHTTDMLVYQSIDTYFTRPNYTNTLDLVQHLEQWYRSHQAPITIVQTRTPSHPVLTLRAQWKLQEIYINDMLNRKQYNYPPYGQIAVIMYKHEIESKVYDTVHQLYRELLFVHQKYTEKLEIYAIPPQIYKKFGKFHYHIIIKWNDVQSFLQANLILLKIRERWFKIDRNPHSLG